MLISKNDSVERSPDKRKGFFDALHRVKGLTAIKRSLKEWNAILIVLRWTVKSIEARVARMDRNERNSKLN